MAMELANPPRTILLPFFGLAHNTLEPWSRSGEQKRFPHAIADWFASEGITARERRMLDFMNQITDKPSWDTKVFDNSIVGKWKKEAVRWDEELPEKGDWWLSGKMFEACLLELREKARRFKDMGFVAVLDAEATIVKSDTVVSHELRDELRQAVHPLEDVPEQMKDYHPGSGEQVLDLVHPSLFPVVFGVSKALPHGTVPLDSCLSYTGKGETIARFDATRHVRKGSLGNEEHIENAWGSFQWLPSNVTFREDGTAKIDSYITNVHPHQYKALYKVLEKFVDVSIPLWNECLSRFDSRIRIKLVDTSKADYVVREGARFPREQYITEDETVDSADEEEEDEEDDDDDAWAENHNRVDELQDWRDDNCVLEQPEPEHRSQTEYCKDHSPRLVDLKKDFADRGIQVIFKLANIHLTPEDPKYTGGSWHIEGSLNEHICATALYYYDCENVTDSRLAFRQSYDVEGITMIPAQHEHSSLESYLGVTNESPAVLDLGSVLAREGRLLVFPNVFQHQVQPFSLADASKPGHRKILAMFLVDPHIPILSTANVPPQRRDWWAEELRKHGPFANLPIELFNMIIEEVDFPMSWDAACEVRERLMEERGMVTDELTQTMEESYFSFCEH